MKKIFFIILLLVQQAWSWGGRCHHTLCEAATFLVKNENLKNYLTTKPHIMGHLCNVPDIYWKNIGSDISKIGSPAHYIDPEILGLEVSQIPTDYQKLIEQFTNSKNKFKEGTIFSIPSEFGSLWWRADQFYRRAIAEKEIWAKAQTPSNAKEEQDDNHMYNKSAYNFTVNIGLMGHFVGDASQPFHATADYDGWESGHGGIHAYYEDTVCAALPPDLMLNIVKEGKKLQSSKPKFLTEKSVIDKMKALSEASRQEVPRVYALDPIIKKSELKKDKGMSLRTPAERHPVNKVLKKYEPLITAQLARSATLLAHLWDQAYTEVGKPKLTSYKSYKYPLTPEFVEPDYYDVKKVK